jgi:transcription elongation GreA/GreB family factor
VTRIVLLAIPLLLSACDIGSDAQTLNQETAAIKAETEKLKSENVAWRSAVLDVCAQGKRVGLDNLTGETVKTLRRECPGYFD